MHLTPRELDKLLIHSLAGIALKRKENGLKLNHPEAVAVISAAALEGARAGKTVEEVMNEARKTLTRNDVMEGVADMISAVQVEAVFTDGSRLITIHNPLNGRRQEVTAWTPSRNGRIRDRIRSGIRGLSPVSRRQTPISTGGRVCRRARSALAISPA